MKLYFIVFLGFSPLGNSPSSHLVHVDPLLHSIQFSIVEHDEHDLFSLRYDTFG